MANGQLNRFQGIDKVDALLADFLQNQLEGSPSVEVLRAGEIESGDPEIFTYPNGETLRERAGDPFRGAGPGPCRFFRGPAQLT